jgi:hypothetical protein
MVNSTSNRETPTAANLWKLLEVPVLFRGKRALAMLDCGAQGNFINPEFITRHQLHWEGKGKPYQLKTVDKSPVTYGKGWVRIETGPASLVMGSHKETINLDVLDIPGHDIILGIPWFRTHDPRIQWTTGEVTFPDQACLKHCATAKRTTLRQELKPKAEEADSLEVMAEEADVT